MWQSVQGSQLVSELFQKGNLNDSLPSTPGIYMWKPNLSHNLLKFDASGILDGLVRTASTLNGSTAGNKLGHSVAVSSILLKGDGLTDPKIKTFTEELQDSDVRKFVIDFLDVVSPHCPSLYVGEGEDICDRVSAHVSGRSDFAERLVNESDWRTSQLNLFYMELPETSKNFRQALEAYVTIMTGAWLVRRPG